MITFAVLCLATAAISFTIARGRVFIPARRWVMLRSTWLGDLVGCPYCTSHYVALAMALWFRPTLLPGIGGIIAQAFAMVAVSALVNTALSSGADQSDVALREALEAARDRLAAK